MFEKVLVLAPAIVFEVLAQGNVAAVSAGYSAPQALRAAPGQVITLFMTGLERRTPVLTGRIDVEHATGLPLPTTLAGISIELRQPPRVTAPVPILSIAQFSACESQPSPPCATVTAATVQIPYELYLPDEPNLVAQPVPARLSISEQGTSRGEIELTPVYRDVHIARALDSVLRPRSGTYYNTPLITDADGSLVSKANPARPGEVLIMYAYGLGRVTGDVKTGDAASAALSAQALAHHVMFRYEPEVPAAPSVIPNLALYAGLTPGYAGLYQVNFVVPPPPAVPLTPGGACGPADVDVGVVLWVLGVHGRPVSTDTTSLCVVIGSAGWPQPSGVDHSSKYRELDRSTPVQLRGLAERTR